MIYSEIVTIGDEIVEGSRLNSNAHWLAKTLTESGLKIRKITTVGDNPSLISNELRSSIKKETELIVTTGGLGPTNDDRTLEGLSKALGVERKENEKALRMIEESYSKLADKDALKKEGLTPARRKMANVPVISKPLPNPIGGAPAVLTEKGKSKILCLPGVPEEMKAILKQNINKLFSETPHPKKNYRTLKVSGIEESSLAPIYNKIEEKFPKVEVRSYPSGIGAKGEITVKISGENKENLSKIVRFFLEEIENLDGVEVKDTNSI